MGKQPWRRRTPGSFPQSQVLEDWANEVSLLDESDDFHVASAARASQRIDVQKIPGGGLIQFSLAQLPISDSEVSWVACGWVLELAQNFLIARWWSS